MNSDASRSRLHGIIKMANEATAECEYVLVSTQTRLECGPTMVGDADSDPELMAYLGATICTRLGNRFAEYVTESHPRLVLNKLASVGFRVVGFAGIGQTAVWTCVREKRSNSGP